MNAMKRFIDNQDGTVSDLEKKLMWTHTDSMIDLKKWVNYQECLDYVRGLNEKSFANYKDWRLPTKDEMQTLYLESASLKDRFGKEIHIPGCFAEGGGFSMIAKLVNGRFRTWVLNLRDGEMTQPEGLWTLTDATRAVRDIDNNDDGGLNS